MPLEVLIATPSGPFGELIRLSLEADPQFKCAILNEIAEIDAFLQENPVEAVIFDCSFSASEPGDVVKMIRGHVPTPAVLLVPPENQSEINTLQAARPDGLITRPFDASVLSEQIQAAINKKNTRPLKPVPSEKPATKETWWNIFQAGIKETAASNGMIVQNGMVIASTPGTSPALQQQVNASVLRFWNPKDSADLMRYVKDLVTGQEWMMYATHAADNAVLVLLFLPQTPITKVRSQTIKLAHDVSTHMTRMPERNTESGYLETTEPPRLEEILGGAPSSSVPGENKKGFPVEWFKEADLSSFGADASYPISPSDSTDSSITSGSGYFEVKTPGTGEHSQENLSIDQEDELKAFEAEINKSTETEMEPTSDLSLDGLDFFSTPLEVEPSTDLSPLDDVPFNTIQDQTGTGLASDAIPSGELSAHITPSDTRPEIRSAQSVSNLEAIPENRQPETALPQDEKNSIDQLGSNLDGNELDLGIFEEFYLHSKPDSESGLDSMQPISLETDHLESSVTTSGVDTPEFPTEKKVESDVEEVQASTYELPGESPLKTEMEGSAESHREPLFNLSSVQPEDQQPLETGIESSGVTDGQLPEADQGLDQADVETGHLIQEPDISGEDHTPEVLFPEVEDTVASAERAEQKEEHPQEQFSVEIEDHQLAASPAEGDLFSRMNQLESAETEENRETYTVALIPRSEADILVRQLAGSLNQAITRLCLALNWELVNLTIRPTFMQWTVSVPLALSLEDMINIVRKETTQEIGKIDPDRISSLQGEDFWAPQNMSAAGKDFVPSIHWQNFILRRNPREIA